jgi:2-amino-4-hydroxy-6-hydroxymethyldihydropteridine diphosphokinase
MKYMLSLGSNVGHGLKNLARAVNLLEEKSISVEECSSVYCSSPVGSISQADFFNISVLADSDCLPEELLKKLKGVENEMGRVKMVDKGPRNIDLDIVFWEKGTHFSKTLEVPHKEALNRLFVIFPTLEIIENSSLFESEKDEIQRMLEHDQEKFIGQRIEKICPFKMEIMQDEWEDS